MKRYYKSLFLLLLLGGFISGCTSTDADDQDFGKIPVTIPTSRPITFDVEKETRAPVTQWSNTQIGMAYGQTVSRSYTVMLNGTVHNNVTSFSPMLFYPVSETMYLRGYYPRADFTDNKVNYIITGQEDIMLSNEVSGSASHTIASQEALGNLYFNHLLTQYSFALKNDGTWPMSVKVKEIRVKGVKTNAVLDLSAAETTAALTFSATPESEFTVYSLPAGREVTTAGTAPIGTFMIAPEAPFSVDVVLNTDSDGNSANPDLVTVTSLSIGAGGSQGYSYLITLTFSAEGIVRDGIQAVSWQEVTVGENTGIPGNLW